MSYFLRICLACLCALSFTYTHAIPPPTPPTIIQLELYRVGAVAYNANPIGVPINTTVKLKFSEQVFNIGGVAFSNGDDVTSFVSFSNSITFTATIDVDVTGQVITIIPTLSPQQLLTNTTYTVGILANKFQNAATDPNVVQTVGFTTAITTTVTPPVTLSLCRNGVAKVLGDILITETSRASFGEGNGQTFELDAPSGFAFVAGVGNVSATGSDVSATTLTVTANKVTLQYDVNTSYANTSVITITGIQVIWISGTTPQDLKRTGGTAPQAGNRVADDVTHATFSSIAPPTAPSPSNYILASGFGIGTNLAPAFTVPSGSTARFYDASNVLVHTSGVSAGTINVTPTQLGYTVNNVVATTTFYMTIVTGTCESTKTSFTITVGSLPKLQSIDLFNLPVTTLPLASAVNNIPINTNILVRFSEQVFNSPSGTAFANGANVFSLITINGGAFTTFTATINVNAGGQTITITPTAQTLLANTTYTIGIAANSFENAAAIKNAAQTVAFTTASAITTSAPTLELCQNGAAEILGNIVITEGSSASFGQGNNQIMEIIAPTGYQFVAGTSNVTFTGLDISNVNLFVSSTKITLLYDISVNYFGTDVISIENLQVKSTTLSNGMFLRTGGNAIQAGNRVADNFSLATLTSVAAPTAPLASIIATTNVCSGFVTTSVLGSVTAVQLAGGTITFYDAITNLSIYSTNTAGNISASNLGYTLSNNTILGSKQFYMTFISSSSCESGKTFFTITINPNPTVYITAGATSLCASDQTTFAITGTVGATNVLQVKFNAGAFSAASAYGTTSTVLGVTYFTTFSTLAAGNYQLQATSTLAGCPDTDVVSFVVKSAPVVTFVWGANPLSYLSTVPFVDLTDGTVFGGAVNAVVSGTTVGTYSGTAVSGTKFYPGIAPIGVPITITYSYTDIVTGCSDSASIVVTVTLIGSITNPVNNLALSYCQSDPISGILTPVAAVIAQGTGIPAPVIAMAPFLNNPPSAPYDPYFNFYNSASEGFVWDGTNYRFNPATVFIPTGNSSVTINVRMNAWLPFRYYFTSVTVYRSPVLDMNVVDNAIFCTGNANSLIVPTVAGIPTAGIVMEYKLQSQPVGSYATLPGGIPNTIVPSLFGAGDYDLRISYTQTVAPFCSNTLVRKFRMKATSVPTMSVQNSLGVAIPNGGNACVGSSINLITTAPFVGGTYSISKLSGGTLPTITATIASASISLPSTPDVYTITLSYADNYPMPFPAGSCIGVSAPYVVNIIANPTPSFTFAAGATTLAICEGVNNFTLVPVAQAIPGTGSYNIRKVGLASAGGIFTTNLIDVTTFAAGTTGIGAGDYDITHIYTYNAANGGCIGASISRTLRINAKPTIDFSFSVSEICNNPTKTIITVTPSLGFGAIIPINGKLRIYNSANTLLLPVASGVYAIDLNSPAFILVSSQINPIAITEFKVEFEYQDANTCINITTPRKSFYVNPLPVPTISFTSVSDFCFGDNNSATFALNATGVGVTSFIPAKGFMTIRNNVGTTSYNKVLPNGVNSFNVSTLLPVLPPGEYLIDYTYADTKSCSEMVTCATILKINAKPVPTFAFPSNSTNYTICETVTSLALTPSIPVSIPAEYGADVSIVNARGTYTFTKGAFSTSFSGTTTGITDTFNPLTLLVNAVGGGIGVYNVTYTYIYTSASGCVGTSIAVQTLTINPAPAVSFVLSATEICNDLVKSTITLTPALVSGTIIPTDGFIRIYASNGTTILANVPNATNIINLNDPLFASLVATISPTAITTLKVEYRYIGTNSCIGVSAQQSIFINPLPVPTIVSTGTTDFCFGDGNSATFTLAATGVYTTPFTNASSVFTVRNNTGTATYTRILVPADFTLTGTTLSFNPSALAGIVSGEYLVEYKYINTKTCALTVTSATIIRIKTVPAVTFKFPFNSDSYAVCQDVTNLILTPTLSNPLSYGVGTFDGTKGQYIITKGAFSWNIPFGVNSFDPQTLLFNDVNGGAGDYIIKYRYTSSAPSCVGDSPLLPTQKLTINLLPTLTFVLSNNNICNYIPADQFVLLTPTWTNSGANTLVPNKGKINIYNSANAKISLSNGTNIISRNFIGTFFTISPTALTTFQIEYEYEDNNLCKNVSARQFLYINPLPLPTISFSSASSFCFGSGAVASFTTNETGGVTTFNTNNGKITIRSNPSSSPAAALYAPLTLGAGITSFNVSTLVPALPVGEYFIDYTYTDIKTCAVTVTCATTLKINSLPTVAFQFVPTTPPFTLVDDYAICANLTSLTLAPTLLNANLYGVENGLNIAKGKYTFTKGSFITTVSNSNTFNPQTLLVNAAGGGVGTYTVSYEYESALGCVGFSVPIQTLTIYPLPVPSFSFLGGDTQFCANETDFTLIPLVSGVAPVIPANGSFIITRVAPAFTFIVTGTNTVLIGDLVGAGTYNIAYKYIDGVLCENISPSQSFIINPLPITTLTFPATVAFPLGDNQFCADETIATVNINYVGVINPLTSFITIRKDGLNIPLGAGVNTFSPLSLASGVTGTGQYEITHTYTDANGCTNTTAPVTFIINPLPMPVFLFQRLPLSPAGTLDICADVTSVTLIPNISNATPTNLFVPSFGFFTIKKAGITVVILPNNVNTFNPNDPAMNLITSAGGIVGNYEVTYTYTDANGCPKTTPAGDNLTINPLPSADFTFDASSVAELTGTGTGTVARVCASFSSVNLIVASPIGVTGTTIYEIQEINVIPAPLPLRTSSPSITASLLGVSSITTTSIREFQVVVKYTNTNGCTTISGFKILKVIPLPVPAFPIPTQRCVGLPVLFDATSSVAQATDIIAATNGYQWNFDGTQQVSTAIFTNTATLVVPSFPNVGNVVVSLTIKSVLGCSKTFTQNVFITAIPVASFTTANFCEGSLTTFTSTSTVLAVGATSIDTYTWDFGDGNVSLPSASPTITHLYATPNRYVATLTVTTNSLCTDIFMKEVFIFPRIMPTAAVPYKENFDNATSDKTWFANGLIKANLNPLIDTIGYSWKRGVPTGLKIKASTTNGGAWSTTSGRANTVGGIDSTFYPNERSYVESPCFNFSDPTLTKPLISMKVWYDTDRGSDGAVLYSSIDDGLTWQAVGTINEGIEWYNTAGIIGQPGGQSVVNAWTGNTFTEYKVAKFNLDQFRGLPSVRFRVAFGSNSDNPVGTAFDGFAFDDVFIGNRNRISLLEHFTNASSSEANTENTFINNFPPTTAQNEIYNIQYHTNVPGADPMNADNTAVPSARALFYGVSQVPRTAIDGAIENRKFSEWGTPVYNKRTLEASPFELSVDFSSTAQQLRFKANVKALEPFTRRVILQTVVIEQEILGTAFTTGNFGGLTFKNIVKGMIPNASGTLIAQTWLQNTQFQTGELVWANVPKIYNGNKLVLVVFVQDEVTKEIYQAGFFNITTNISPQDPTTALDPQTQTNLLENEFVVYPNPAQNEVFIGFRDETAEDFKVVIFDSYGKRLDTFSLTKGHKGLLLNTEKYASGMYFVEIIGKNNIKTRKKLVIAR